MRYLNANIDLNPIFENDTFNVAFEIQNEVAGVCLPYDLSTSSVEFRVSRRGINTPTQLLLSTAPDVVLYTGTDVLTDPSTITILQDNISLNKGVYYYTLSVLDGTNRRVWLYGTITIVSHSGEYEIHFNHGDIDRSVVRLGELPILSHRLII